MPVHPTYPGVYVEEIPSGIHPIAGVSTSVTAFVDFFDRGLANVATRITSFSDFERIFGGLNTNSEASYAISQFYLNGGQDAWVVRAVTSDMQTASYTLTSSSPPHDTLLVAAASPGSWASNLTNKVQLAVDYKTRKSSTTQLFNLVVREVAVVNGKQQPVNVEIYRNMTMDSSKSNYVVATVNAASSLVHLTDVGLGEVPNATGTDVIGSPQDSDFIPLSGGTESQAFDNDGNVLHPDLIAGALVDPTGQTNGMYALDRIAPFIFNILCMPLAVQLDNTNFQAVYAPAETYCEDKRAFLLIDIPKSVDTLDQMTTESKFLGTLDNLRHRNAAVYFPRLLIPDPLNENRLRSVGPSGTMAGVYARTDGARGVWKAPAGTDAALRNASLPLKLTDLENGELNPLGINVLRSFPIFGRVCWGARTLDGADQQASEWKYIPVRRTALFIEESLYEGLKWVVFEPNAEPLWAQIRLNVGAFMQNLFRQGAFQGQTRNEAYFVKCDNETTTQNDIDLGIVNIVVGFAPLKPAEFVIIQIQQMAGQIQV